MIMKRPSMRSAKIPASDTVARSSGALMREDVADGLDIGNDIRMNGWRNAGGLQHTARRFEQRDAAALQSRETSPDGRPETRSPRCLTAVFTTCLAPFGRCQEAVTTVSKSRYSSRFSLLLFPPGSWNKSVSVGHAPTT